MKLRNKKTGEIGEFIGTYNAVPFIGIGIDYHDGNPVKYEYNNLTELNEEWEDYEPVEPLIKDEKIRKAVKAWAEANRVTEAMYSSCHDAECEFNARDDENKMIVFIGNFQEMNERLDITGRTIYTIEELCGSEE